MIFQKKLIIYLKYLFHRIQKLLSHAKKLNIEHILKRPKYLALSNTPKILAIKHLLNYSEIFYNTKFDYIVDLDVTSPLRTKKI